MQAVCNPPCALVSGNSLGRSTSLYYSTVSTIQRVNSACPPSGASPPSIVVSLVEQRTVLGD